METLSKKNYRAELKKLQVKLSSMQRWVQHSGERIVILFEGRDTAGKGGAINAFSQVLNPRGCRVVALNKPSDTERSQWYFQRYVSHLPSAGEIVLFDRSWYNRAGVEKVMGFCNEAQHLQFLRDCPVFEKTLLGDGIRLFKYWFSVDQEKQEQRFAERVENPIKRWKISPIDLAARSKYLEYGKARDEMLKATHSKESPWFIVNANDQKRARLNMISHYLDQLPKFTLPKSKVELPPLPNKKLGVEKILGPSIAVAEKF